MARDEADIAPYWCRHYFNEGVDFILCADNLSTDGTGDILRDEGCIVVPDGVLAYQQAKKMNRLARLAADLGATWILPVDLDELWYSVDGLPLVDTLKAQTAAVVACPVFDHVVREATDGNPFTAHPWRRREAQKFPVVAYRWDPAAVLAMGNHSVSHPGPRVSGPIAVRHFQYRSLGQMTRKFRQGKAAYDATDMPETEGTHWREGGALSDVELAARWAALCGEPGLVFDPAPYRAVMA